MQGKTVSRHELATLYILIQAWSCLTEKMANEMSEKSRADAPLRIVY